MTLAATVLRKKQQLDAMRADIRIDAFAPLDHSQRLDITYTSNAIEGNTLTAGETALVIEKGITVAGKPLRDHLEAIDHAAALEWVLDIASRSEAPIREADVRTLHSLVVAKSQPKVAGRYADLPRYVNTERGLFEFPPPLEVPVMMRDFAAWLGAAEPVPATAFEAHRRLVAIHPFSDGNGRTARLLMNLVLARAGYPPIAVRPEDRPAYIAALEADQSGRGHELFDSLLYRRLDQTLDMYLDAARVAKSAKAAISPEED